MNLRRLAIAGSVALAMSGVAQATVYSFEGGADPAFTYSGVDFLNGGSYTPAASGYHQVSLFTASDWVAFNPYEASPASFMLAGAPTATFTLNSFVIAGAWGSQTLTVEGYNDGVLVHSSALGVTPAAATFSPGWTGIDELRITTGSDFANSVIGGDGKHWALDNLTINESAAPIPEPETYAMMLAGLGLLGVVARRRRQNAAA